VVSERRDSGGGPVDAVLFDMDGVVRTWDSAVFAHVEAELGIRPEDVAAAVAQGEALWPLATTGRMSDGEYRAAHRARLVSAFGDHAAEEILRAWTVAQRVDHEVVGLIAEIRHRYAVGLVSNATARLSDDLVRLGLDGAFDAVVISALVGARKPDLDIYLEAVRRLGTRPDRCVFVDDSQPNVDGAAAAGMRGVRYVDARSLRAALTALGLLP